jgi:hypothetical protein
MFLGGHIAFLVTSIVAGIRVELIPETWQQIA